MKLLPVVVIFCSSVLRSKSSADDAPLTCHSYGLDSVLRSGVVFSGFPRMTTISCKTFTAGLFPDGIFSLFYLVPQLCTNIYLSKGKKRTVKNLLDLCE